VPGWLTPFDRRGLRANCGFKIDCGGGLRCRQRCGVMAGVEEVSGICFDELLDGRDEAVGFVVDQFFNQDR
jgi:hypothetical protein